LAEPEIVTRKVKPVSVIIPIKDDEELLERAEDAEDAAWLKKARRTPLHYRPLEDYVAETRLAPTTLWMNCIFSMFRLESAKG
jgi:hypothetical protein